MTEKDATINPKPIISLMLAISVGFWASQLAKYVTAASEGMRSEAKALDKSVKSYVDNYVKDVNDDMSSSAQQLQSNINNELANHLKAVERSAQLSSIELELQINRILKDHMDATAGSARSDAKELRSRLRNEINEYVSATTEMMCFNLGDWRTWATLLSGFLFLIDLLCILWWYARYIYRVGPKASFWTYFLDFVICSMFALAANSWTKPVIFMLATVWGSLLLCLRFCRLYRSPKASMTDKLILSEACRVVILALFVAIAGIMLAQSIRSHPKTLRRRITIQPS